MTLALARDLCWLAAISWLAAIAAWAGSWQAFFFVWAVTAAAIAIDLAWRNCRK